MRINHSVCLSLFTALILAVICLGAQLRATDVIFTPLFFGKHQITVEIANSYKKREIGLMHRKVLGAGMGMLFLFPDSDYRSFWMKNTLIELDIIYLDSYKRIVDIHSHVPPCVADPCLSYPSSVPAQYVLELDGGEAQRLGMGKGDRLDFIVPAKTIVE